MNRRQFVQLTVAALGLGAVAFPAVAKVRQRRCLSACSDHLGQHYVAAFSMRGDIDFISALPFRGHAFAIDRRRQVIFCLPRRPGRSITVLNDKGKQIKSLVAPVGMHFYGHGVCADNGLLYTTENTIDTGAGVIGIYDTNRLQRLGQFSSGGIGPHEVCLSADGQRLIVANGGIRTHPASGRKKLNLETMQPCLSIIDVATGALLQSIHLPEAYHQNSIRHLAVGADALVVVALQSQTRLLAKQKLLLAYDLLQDRLSVFDVPLAIRGKIKGYLGSIAIDDSRQYVAATAPKGGFILFYSRDGQLLAYDKRPDVCGLLSAQAPGQFIVTTGRGEVGTYCVSGYHFQYEKMAHAHALQWDNHLAML